ncbi:MAG: acyl-CoA dehydrogenase, partial [Kiritimatiellales bacterium]|nr:acyl-CoA dehydrogenase [Kiritimatiellales bacterium]
MAGSIDWGISEDQQEIINLIDDFGKERIVPVRAELDEKGIFPADLLN